MNSVIGRQRGDAPTLARWRPRLGAATVFGFATAVVMWCVWFVTHLPGLATPPGLTGPLLVSTLALGAAAAGWAWAGRAAWQVGAATGLICSGLNLLILGSYLAEQPEEGAPAPGMEGLRPAASIMVIGFLALGAVIGAAAGAAGAWLRRDGRGEHSTPMPVWLWRFAVVACASVAPLLLVGGLVTSTEAGMAVPDWPGTYGANMFLYPIGLMADPRIFLEHTHRLFGSLVGLTTLALMVFVLLVDRRKPVQRWSVGIFVLVCVQGVMGGWRVTEASQTLALVHGVTAQIFFALLVGLAAALYPLAAQPAATAEWSSLRRVRGFALALVIVTVLQLLLGAMFRHYGSAHALWTHVGFSIAVVVMAMAAGAAAVKASQTAPALANGLRRTGTALIAVIIIQFLLGWAALGAVLMSGGREAGGMARGAPPTHEQLADLPPPRLAGALITTAHQANGAALLALAGLTVVLASRLRPEIR